MDSPATKARFSALREAICINEDFTTCLAYTTHTLDNKCLNLHQRTAQDNIAFHFEAMFKLIDEGRWTDHQYMAKKNEILENLSKAVVCKGFRHLTDGKKIDGISQPQWRYVKQGIEKRLRQYIESSETSSGSKRVIKGTSHALPCQSFLQGNHPHGLKSPKQATRTQVSESESTSEDEDENDSDDSDGSFMSLTRAQHDVFSPDSSRVTSLWSRETTPFDEHTCSKPVRWGGGPFYVPDTPVPRASVEKSRHDSRAGRTPSFSSAEESDCEDSEDFQKPTKSAVTSWLLQEKPQANKVSTAQEKPQLSAGTANSKISNFWSTTSATVDRRRSISNRVGAHPKPMGDTTSHKPRSIDVEEGLARHHANGKNGADTNPLTPAKKISKERTESVKLASDTPKKSLQGSPNGRMEYGPSGTKTQKEHPVCDILQTMREPTNKEYDAGWIYAYRRSEAPELLKIGRTSGVEKGDIDGFPDGEWKDIKAGRRLTGLKKSRVPGAVIARMTEWKNKCDVGELTLEHYSAHIPRGVEKTEKFIHQTLHMHAQYVSCQCKGHSLKRVEHSEWFRLDLEEAASIIGTWCGFMITQPYGKYGFIREFWQSQCAGFEAVKHKNKTVEIWFNDDFKELLRIEAEKVAEAERKAKQEMQERLERKHEEEIRKKKDELRKLIFGREASQVAFCLRRTPTC